MSEKIGVLVLDGESSFSLRVVRALAAFGGFSVHVLTTQPSSALRWSRHVSSCLLIEKGATDALRLDTIRGLARNHAVQVLLPLGEKAVCWAVAWREQLAECAALPALPAAAALDVARNKARLGELLRSCSELAAPRQTVALHDSDVDDLVERVGLPVICKPPVGEGGRGISRADTVDMLRLRLKSLDPGEELVVQEFIEGYDVDGSVLARDGQVLNITVQRALVSRAGSFKAAAGIEFVDNADVRTMVTRLMKTLSWSGVAHVDLRFDSRDGITKIIEINPRYWGSILGSVRAGVNFPALACLDALGRRLPPMKQVQCRYVESVESLRAILFGSRESGWRPRWLDTGLRFQLSDPVPELMLATRLAR